MKCLEFYNSFSFISLGHILPAIWIFMCSAGLTSQSSFAGSNVPKQSASLKQGPHGGEVLQDGSYQFEVKIDQDGNAVDVYPLGNQKSLPNNMDLTLFRSQESGDTIRLQTLRSPNPGEARYHGNLPPHLGSYIGIELKFETSLKSMKVLKNVPPIPKKNAE